MSNRLVYQAQKSKFMHNDQYGFTPGKGTEHALHELRRTEEGYHERGNDCCLIMMDVKGAFNNLWGSVIYSQVGKMRYSPNIYRLAHSFLSERSVIYRTTYSSLERQYDKGCSQGSNSGPFFWNIVVHSLLELDLEEFFRIIAYGDDFAVLIEAPNAYICSRRANIVLEKISKWAKLHKLTFSGAEKTI